MKATTKTTAGATPKIRLSKDEKSVLAMIVGSGPISKKDAGPQTSEVCEKLSAKKAVSLRSGAYYLSMAGKAYATKQGIGAAAATSKKKGNGKSAKSVADEVAALVEPATAKKRSEPDAPKTSRAQEILGQPAAAVVRLLGTTGKVDVEAARRICKANGADFSTGVLRNLLWRGRRTAAGKGKASWTLATLPKTKIAALVRQGKAPK